MGRGRPITIDLPLPLQRCLSCKTSKCPVGTADRARKDLSPDATTRTAHGTSLRFRQARPRMATSFRRTSDVREGSLYSGQVQGSGQLQVGRMERQIVSYDLARYSGMHVIRQLDRLKGTPIWRPGVEPIRRFRSCQTRPPASTSLHFDRSDTLARPSAHPWSCSL